jgi:hypothetical protein
MRITIIGSGISDLLPSAPGATGVPPALKRAHQ